MSLTPDQYRALRRRLDAAGLLRVSSLAGAATMAIDLAASALIAWGLMHVRGLAWWGLQAVAGLLLFRWFVVVHEAGHNGLFRARWANVAAGTVASMACLIPFTPWRNVHALHHRWVGVIDRDPTQSSLLDLPKSSAGQDRFFRFLWFFWLPLPFYRFLLQTYWLYPFTQWRAGDRRTALEALASCALAFAPHAVVIAVFGPLRWLMAYAPMYIVFLFIIENVTIPQHAEFSPHVSATHPEAIPYVEQDSITRSTHLPDVLGVVLALNFNRHTEHHLFPGAPWYALNRVRREMLASGWRHPHEVAFPGFMLAFRRRDPLVIYRDSLPPSA